MGRGEPTSEKLVQDYVSKLYKERYDGTGHFYHSRIVTTMLEGVILKDGKYSDKILDVGCGVGFVSSLYPSFDIIGIDISDGMLSNNPHKWVKGSAESIPFPDNSFDFVVCRSLLHHLDDPNIGLKEMYRVLKPGGKFACWDPNHSFLNGLFRKLFQKTDRFSHLHKSFKDNELIEMIEKARFKITDKKYIGFLAYPLIGFPDIIKFPVSITLARFLMWLDEKLSKTFVKKIAWSLMIRAVKP